MLHRFATLVVVMEATVIREDQQIVSERYQEKSYSRRLDETGDKIATCITKR